MNCYIFEDENIGVIGVTATNEVTARHILGMETSAIASKSILLDCISEDNELYDEMLDSYGCDVL